MSILQTVGERTFELFMLTLPWIAAFCRFMSELEIRIFKQYSSRLAWWRCSPTGCSDLDEHTFLLDEILKCIALSFWQMMLGYCLSAAIAGKPLKMYPPSSQNPGTEYLGEIEKTAQVSEGEEPSVVDNVHGVDRDSYLAAEQRHLGAQKTMVLVVNWLILLLIYCVQLKTVLPGGLDAAAVILASVPMVVPYQLYKKNPLILWIAIFLFNQLCCHGLHLFVKDYLDSCVEYVASWLAWRMGQHFVGVLAGHLIKTLEQPEGRRWDYFVNDFFDECMYRCLDTAEDFGGVWLEELRKSVVVG